MGLSPIEVLADYDLIEEWAEIALERLHEIIDLIAVARQIALEANEELRL